MAERMLQQIDCTSGDAQLTVCVEAGRVTEGDSVTFKETGELLWRVVWVYQATFSGVNRGWGLDLPKSQRTER